MVGNLPQLSGARWSIYLILAYVAPKIGLGIDRLVMILLNEENIREVIPFPKIGNGFDPKMDTSSEVDDD